MNNNFADNLKKIRKEKNLSQEQLAAELGVSRQAISKWESATAYPEMEKIIALCEKFNVNIDDLLHKDIKEVTREEESKKNLNKYVDDFLNFITDTLNLLSNMTLKSKLKCFFEEIILITSLIMISLIGFHFLDFIFDNLFHFLPYKLYYYINGILNSILILFLAISSIVIFIHIFKTRYLDYYSKLKKQMDEEEQNQSTDSPIEKKKEPKTKPKIFYKQKENKIIIRDPKHSEYRFINGLLKCLIAIIKFFAFCFGIFLSLILIGIFVGFILSFLFYKTGIFFIGLLGACLSMGILDILAILGIINFVWNRQNDKKKMIWCFISNIIIFGISCGFIFIGTLNFDLVENDKSLLKTETIEIEMQDNLFYHGEYPVEYIETNTNTIKMEYKINKFCASKVDYPTNQGIYIWEYCSNPLKRIREEIKTINEKKRININSSITDIKIYASKETIAKLKENKQAFEENRYQIKEKTNSYQKQLQEKEKKIIEYQKKLSEYESIISDLKTELNESQNLE